MATNLTTTYAGKLALPYFSPALLQLNSLSNGALTVKQNILGKAVVKHGLVTGGLQGETCDWNDPSTITLTERILDPKAFEIKSNICKTDFLADWEVENMGPSAWKSTGSTGLQQWLIPQLLADGMASLENMIWQGTTGANAFDGFETLFAADGNVIDVSTPVAITPATVIDEMGRVKAAMTTAMKQQPDAAILVSYSVGEAYIDALGGFASNGLGANGVDAKGTLWFNGQPLTFGGIRVIVCNGMKDGSMVGSYTSNLWFGTNLLSDTTMIKTLDMEDKDLSNNVRFKAMFHAGVQYGDGSNVVFYAGV